MFWVIVPRDTFNRQEAHSLNGRGQGGVKGRGQGEMKGVKGTVNE